ncbi:MAG: hypothetical protein HQ549_01315 [Candidatus Omnitrophica bacterium]|nr:hypothetical protein [Candidatus Omnitrophota bacterium]
MTPTLKEIIEKCDKLRILEKRHVTDSSCELVFSDDKSKNLNDVFTDILGFAVKPMWRKPSGYDKRLTRKFGGIQQHQQLFAKKFDTVTIVAMFRPWQGRTHVTVKLAILDNADIEKKYTISDALRTALMRFFTAINEILSEIIEKLSNN